MWALDMTAGPHASAVLLPDVEVRPLDAAGVVNGVAVFGQIQTSPRDVERVEPEPARLAILGDVLLVSGWLPTGKQRALWAWRVDGVPDEPFFAVNESTPEKPGPGPEPTEPTGPKGPTGPTRDDDAADTHRAPPPGASRPATTDALPRDEGACALARSAAGSRGTTVGARAPWRSRSSSRSWRGRRAGGAPDDAQRPFAPILDSAKGTSPGGRGMLARRPRVRRDHRGLANRRLTAQRPSAFRWPSVLCS